MRLSWRLLVITDTANSIARFRKKYTLTLLIFATGSVHAFWFAWSAGEYTAFVSLLLGLFGSADLVDKKVTNK